MLIGPEGLSLPVGRETKNTFKERVNNRRLALLDSTR